MQAVGEILLLGTPLDSKAPLPVRLVSAVVNVLGRAR